MGERILVANQERLPGPVEFLGLHRGLVEHFEQAFFPALEWRERNDELENDPTYLQLIPYGIVTVRVGHHPYRRPLEYVLTGQRLRGGSESRLHDAYTLGFGGHIAHPGFVNIVQPTAKEWVMMGLRQEFKEELGLDLTQLGVGESVEFLGVLHDGTNAVGQVHLGVVFEVHIAHETADRVRSQEPHKLTTHWAAPHALKMLEPQMENWAKLVYHGHLAQG